MEKLEKGQASEPRHYYDNYNLYLDQELTEIKRETIKPYTADVVVKQDDDVNQDAALPKMELIDNLD